MRKEEALYHPNIILHHLISMQQPKVIDINQKPFQIKIWRPYTLEH
jgi:hypothetical protein